MKTIHTIYEKNIDLSIFEPYKINCGECCGLCCVALYCTKSDGFPHDKEMGAACVNLLEDYKCKVHSKLLQRGLKGCLAYDCFGAGQFLTQQLKYLPDWRTGSPKEADKISNSYIVVLRVHQTLWYLSQCLILRLPQSEKERARSLINEGNALIEKPVEMLAILDPQPFCERSNEYLKHVCSIYETISSNVSNLQSSNYMGKNMQRKNLARFDFRMSLLIAANLMQADLHGANFLGADMRDTNICNTDLSQCLFLTQIQINSARGNHNTILPPYLNKPRVWDNN